MNSRAEANLRTVRCFETARGALIFQIPLQVFPILSGYAYLVLVEDAGQEYRVLIDTGSGYGDSNANLEQGLRSVSELCGISLGLQDLTHVLITHGHIDHFGGLAHVRSHTSAQVGVHELDLRNLTNYDERLTMVARRLAQYLIEAGVPESEQEGMIQMYLLTKRLYHSVRVDFTYESCGMQVGPFKLLHVPGHCAGHVVIRLEDVLFSGDHVLNDTSPHQSPEHLTLSTGLDHYLKSLDLLERWAVGVRLVLGGHKEPIFDLPGRIGEIRSMHADRLARVLNILDGPRSVNDVSRLLFGEVHGYNILLALEEAGAHVEYLYQRGLLGIANLDDLMGSDKSVPLLYHRLAGQVIPDE
jgi:glyoxylase-like metal-dependent hydrolase (beta-lactamase superfamily II)